ncbi:Hypothetical predicted protein [Drosophila guanche]|uniref:Uncharacterized protein n=1 Tax=Drosophila guanche TaxID=7266 RepID=A0A3B0JT18_DROGU|nr:Hypothetical predicted protein [Drosophila guanche]
MTSYNQFEDSLQSHSQYEPMAFDVSAGPSESFLGPQSRFKWTQDIDDEIAGNFSHHFELLSYQEFEESLQSHSQHEPMAFDVSAGPSESFLGPQSRFNWTQDIDDDFSHQFELPDDWQSDEMHSEVYGLSQRTTCRVLFEDQLSQSVGGSSPMSSLSPTMLAISDDDTDSVEQMTYYGVQCEEVIMQNTQQDNHEEMDVEDNTLNEPSQAHGESSLIDARIALVVEQLQNARFIK